MLQSWTENRNNPQAWHIHHGNLVRSPNPQWFYLSQSRIKPVSSISRACSSGTTRSGNCQLSSVLKMATHSRCISRLMRRIKLFIGIAKRDPSNPGPSCIAWPDLVNRRLPLRGSTFVLKFIRLEEDQE
ncbi:hypothetical protein RvY_04033-2 [Ramazzottius varieornatus]|uniref:Uncharacterized protein n=1 Tax=Ramazzottius varieornatus TaxID=947166 RepID=A0A1D1UQ69_RAMVA|nr:hypothetical protein RvY_04033-2 [Ramazzottius varieornatus]